MEEQLITCYQLDRKQDGKYGIALLINNTKFTSELKERKGADKDKGMGTMGTKLIWAATKVSCENATCVVQDYSLRTYTELSQKVTFKVPL